MMNLRYNIKPDPMSVLRSSQISNDQYLYLSARTRTLELQMMDQERTARLFDARSVEDVGRILSDCAYPTADNPEASLNLEMSAVFDMLGKQMPHPEFIDVMLMLHDFHNLKVILKSLTPAWSKRSQDELDDVENLPEAAAPYGLASVSELDSYFLAPSMIDPKVLYPAIRDRQSANLPAWIYTAAIEAAKAYQLTYDIGMIDTVCDKSAYNLAIQQAESLNNDFFLGYFQLLIDQANWGTLLRCRTLKRKKDLLKRILIDHGSRPSDFYLDLYDEPTENIQLTIAGTRFKAMAELAATYGQPGTATQFSRLADNQIIEYISRAKLLWCGPEVPLAFLIGRLMEIKNIRIVLTCLQNGMSGSQSRELSRDSYSTWR